MAQRPALPIDAILGEIEAALATPGNNLVIEAAPGAGKTTAVPLSLLRAGGLVEQRACQGRPHKILVLEPRRIAARMAAGTCANWAATTLGDRVGYRVRFESAVSEKTELCFVTQALYLRMLLGNPRLEDYAVVVFDEFHERNLASDLALALTLALQRDTRPDLQIVAMSATLDAEPVARYLNAQSFRNEGRSFPVTIHHQNYSRKQGGSGGPSLLRTLMQVESDAIPGHILVFLPGLGAIEAQAQKIAAWAQAHQIQVHRLHGSMNKAAQKEVVAPSSERKIILATNVAESSVTIPGVGVVIDFGTAKIARSDLLTGKTLLEERPVSRASAVQRSGRAGRTAPGHAFRLYSEADFKRRAPFERPEIERLDPTSTVLNIAALDYDPRDFPWFEAPKEGAMQSAMSGLESLGLMNEGGITDLGRLCAQLPLDPPAARCVVEVARADLQIAARVGAVLGVDESTLSGLQRYRPATDLSDVQADLAAWTLAEKKGPRSNPSLRTLNQHRESIARTLSGQRSLLKALGPGLFANFSSDDQEDWIRCCLALGFQKALGKLESPDQPSSRIVLARAQSAVRHESSTVQGGCTWVVVLSGQERGGKSYATRLSAVQEEWLLEISSALESKIKVEYDEQRQEVRASEAWVIGQVTVEESPLDTLPPAGVDLLVKKSMAAGFNQFFDLAALQQFLARCAFVHRFVPTVPTPTMTDVEQSWRRLCTAHRKFSQLKEANFVAHFRHEYQEHLPSIDAFAPSHLTLASGRRLALTYEGDREPGISSRLQNFFGSKTGPSVAQGQVPVRLHLLAPNGRDVQVTTDLEGFWERHYPALRKTLMRRYPRHAWPEDPENAEPPKPRPRRPRRK